MVTPTDLRPKNVGNVVVVTELFDTYFLLEEPHDLPPPLYPLSLAVRDDSREEEHRAQAKLACQTKIGKGCPIGVVGPA